MATPTTLSPTIRRDGEDVWYEWSITTTADIATADEIELLDAPEWGTITRVQQTHTSGTGTISHQPKMGTITSFAGTTQKYQATSTVVATAIDDPPSNGKIGTYRSAGKSMFYVFGPANGTDNIFVTIVTIKKGWH